MNKSIYEVLAELKKTLGDFEANIIFQGESAFIQQINPLPIQEQEQAQLPPPPEITDKISYVG